MTKKVVSKVLDPIIRSTCTQPLVSEGVDVKSLLHAKHTASRTKLA
jgi:hypothetical protein